MKVLIRDSEGNEKIVNEWEISKCNFSSDEIVEMERQLVNDPNNVKLLTDLAFAYTDYDEEDDDAHKYKFEKMDNFYTRALEIEPNNFATLVNAASTYMDFDYGEKASQLLQRAYNINKNDDTLLFKIASYYQYYDRDNEHLAKQFYKKCIKISPDYPEAKERLQAIELSHTA